MPKLVANGLSKLEFETMRSASSIDDQDIKKPSPNSPLSCNSEFWALPSRFVDRWLKYWLRMLAYRVAYHPFLFALLPFVVSIVFIGGIPLLSTETEYHKLWYPTNTEQFADLQYLWNNYGFDNRSELVIVSLKSGGLYENSEYGILDKGALLEVYNLQKDIINPNTSSYQEVCSRLWLTDNSTDTAPCVTNSILDIWGLTSSYIENKSQTTLMSDINADSLKSVYGIDLFLPSMIGGEVEYISSTDNGTEVKSATALQMVYSVDRQNKKKALDYELEFSDVLADFKSDNIEVFYAAFRTFQDESDKAIAEDQIYVTWAMILMIFYVSVMLGKCDPVHSKILLSLCIIVTISLSLIFAFGMSGFLGYPLSQLSLMAIFILLGVGVDDMFIMVDAWDRADGVLRKKYKAYNFHVVGTKEQVSSELPPTPATSMNTKDAIDKATATAPLNNDINYEDYDAERLGITFSDIGASILLTSLTDFTALLIGSTIAIPAVSYFCITAALSVLAIFSIQVTFFASMLIFDERRVRASRVDVFFCAVYNNSHNDATAAAGGGGIHDSGEKTTSGAVMPVEKMTSEPTSTDSVDLKYTTLPSSPTGQSDDLKDRPFPNRQEEEAASKQSGPRAMLAKFVDTVATNMLHPSRAIAVVLLFLIVDISIGILSLETVNSSADWSEFLPAGSSLLDFYDARDEYGFGSVGTLQFVTTKTVDVANNDHIEVLIKLYNQTSDMDFVVGVESWFNTFMTWCEDPDGYNGTSLLSYADGDATKRDLLKLWVQDTDSNIGGYRYAQAPMIVFENGQKGDDGYLKTSRFIAITTNLKPGVLKNQLNDMHEARSTVSNLGVLDIRAITTEYAYLAREERMWRYTRSTIFKTLSGVFFISLLFLEPWLAILTTISVFLVVMALFGTMAPIFWNIKLNVSSFINLVLAIGFAVDYSAHIAEGFMVKGHHDLKSRDGEERHEQSSTPTSPSSPLPSSPLQHHTQTTVSFSPLLAPRERVHETMIEVGGSVLNGGLSTLLGVLVLIFSESAGFVTLFKMFLSMVIFGLLHGLVFLPCVIYLVALLLEHVNGTSGDVGGDTTTKSSSIGGINYAYSSNEKEVEMNSKSSAPSNSIALTQNLSKKTVSSENETEGITI